MKTSKRRLSRFAMCLKLITEYFSYNNTMTTYFPSIKTHFKVMIFGAGLSSHSRSTTSQQCYTMKFTPLLNYIFGSVSFPINESINFSQPKKNRTTQSPDSDNDSHNDLYCTSRPRNASAFFINHKSFAAPASTQNTIPFSNPQSWPPSLPAHTSRPSTV